LHATWEVARRFDVSESLVKKLITQKKRLGHVRPLYERVGRKPSLSLKEQDQLLLLIKQEPNITLYGMRKRLNFSCSIQAIHRTLQRMGVLFEGGKRYVAVNGSAKSVVRPVANSDEKAKTCRSA
ncbi:MAG: hypothetical protein LBE15_03465, partial [Burkholderiales bacterium]|nr:hypothetical protein [Burkholderiales bacterium]